MLTLTQCKTLTSRRGRRKLANNTYLERRGDGFAVRLHQTDIVTVGADGSVTVKTGGWRTSTTKNRINRFTSAGIYQKSGNWFTRNGQPFYEGMEIR